jgi:phage terminase large subunit-like protein
MMTSIEQLMNIPEGRRALSGASPVFFDSYYLKMSEAAHRTRALETIERLEKEGKESGQKKKLLVLQPRGHGKSLLSISYCLRKICMNRNTSILFISASAGQAEKRVRLIKQFLESNKVVEDWASGDMIPFKGAESKWTSTQLYVQREGASVDPTLEAIGSGGKITGAHVDIVIIDDLEDDITTSSAGVRAKTRDWLNATVMPILNQGGLMLVIGTRKNADDCYAHMKADPTFEVIEEPAIIKWPKNFTYEVEKDERGREKLTGVKVEGDYEVLWPEFRPIEHLLMERRSMGPTLFAREMQNEVNSIEDAVIKPDWIEAAKSIQYSLGDIPPQLDLEDCVVVQSWDLSIESDAKKAAQGDTDWTVGYTIARDSQGLIWILDVWRKRGISQNAILDGIVGQYNKWSDWVRTVVVEKNSFGALYIQQLQKTSMPVKPINMTRHNNLKIGIHKLAVLFENNLMKFPSKDEVSKSFLDVFTLECVEWPASKHDDTLDALMHGVQELQKNHSNYQIAIGDKVIDNKGNIHNEGESLTGVIGGILNEMGIDTSGTYSKEEAAMLARFGIGYEDD